MEDKATIMLTLKDIQEATKTLRDNAIPPHVIKTQEAADSLTRVDPTGRTWKIGDEYYIGGIDLGIEHKTTK